MYFFWTANSDFVQQFVLILQITGIDKEVYIKVKHSLCKSKKFQQGKIKHEEKRKKTWYW